MKNTIALFAFVVAVCLPCHAAGQNDGKLRAGATAIDITPKIFPLHMPGQFTTRMAESAHDPLHSRALVLDDGKALVGFVTSEAADLLVMRDAQGAEHRVAKAAIEERSKLPTSAMPEGLVADLSVAQFASLLDYIEGMKIK